MENLASDTGVQVQWSNWSRCESSFSMLLVPHRPGILALAEEIAEAGTRPQQRSVAEPWNRRRMLALFHVEESRDLSLSVSALFTSGHPARERLGERPCYVRYALISDPEDRASICQALQAWMQAAAEAASGIAAEAQPAPHQQEKVEQQSKEESDSDPGDCTTAPRALAELPNLEAAGDSSPTRPLFPAGF